MDLKLIEIFCLIITLNFMVGCSKPNSIELSETINDSLETTLINEAGDTVLNTELNQSGKLISPFDSIIFQNSENETICIDTNNRFLQIPERDLINKIYNQEQLIQFESLWQELMNYSDALVVNQSQDGVECLNAFFEFLAHNNSYVVQEECSAGNGDAHWLGGYQRSLVTAGLALFYLKIKSNVDTSATGYIEIQEWFTRLLECSKYRATDMIEKSVGDGEGPFNQRYPALFAVVATAIVVNDSASFHWAIDELENAMATIGDDGTARSEILHKEESAFHYHVLILNFCVHMAVLSEINGRPILNNPGLNRLIELVLSATIDPSYFEEITGFTQTNPLNRPENFSWALHLQHYKSDSRINNIVEQYSVKFKHEHTGGDPALWW